MSVSAGTPFAAQAAVGQPVPRVGPQRRRSAAMASLGVVLVVVGALAGWRYIAAASAGQHTYLAVYRQVGVGSRITADDLQTVSITTARGLTPIPASRLDTVVGQYAAVDLVPGTLLAPAELTPTDTVGAGQALVGLNLSAGERPGRTLRAGDRVLLVSVPPPNSQDSASGGSTPLPGMTATVVETFAPDPQNNAVVDVVIPVDDVPVVTAYASRGLIAVVVVTGG